MSVLLGCWVLGICVVLIWCSLRVSEGEGTSWGQQESTKGHLEYITRLVLYDKAAATRLDSGKHTSDHRHPSYLRPRGEPWRLGHMR
jgi:hypothetical protein